MPLLPLIYIRQSYSASRISSTSSDDEDNLEDHNIEFIETAIPVQGSDVVKLVDYSFSGDESDGDTAALSISG